MSIFVHGLRIRNYRGIGPDAQELAPLQKFNFFIGSNNSGKSTVLNFLSNHLVGTRDVSELDRHQGPNSGTLRHARAYDANPILEHLSDVLQDSPLGAKLVGVLSLRGRLWLTRTKSGSYELEQYQRLEEVAAGLPAGEWSYLWRMLTQRSGGDLLRDWVPEVLTYVASRIEVTEPPVALIPAIREIGSKTSEFNFSGGGLISRLAEIQSPDHNRQSDRKMFQRINDFVRDVLGKPHATIEIPHHRDYVLVHLDGKVLPLSSLGTGIHELIMLASFCTLTREHVVCIEEPEIHLHPLLQRKLVRYLHKHTNNQYFIATHSAAFIDTPGAAVFHVSNDGNQTTIRETALRSERVRVCEDLGYRASDIVQSNAVIWVEGPSDRIYLRHWIEAVAPELVEGLHYSIMFYGGRLLNHLSADADEISEFINLRSLNQHLAIIMDSDRKSAHAPISDTKKRIRAAFEGPSEQLCWITKGREIENYVDHSRLQSAVRSVYPLVYGAPVKGELYDHALWFMRSAPRRQKDGASPVLLETDVDKVRVARAVCAQPAHLDILDLRQRVAALVEMIRAAND